mmetsp:Transcript_9095/g.17359  ORF Transcript_9095/g.17359 Transcript_9095/m.17359 type:complete len:261 (-) Transcript_9095:314-1096(-)
MAILLSILREGVLVAVVTCSFVLLLHFFKTDFLCGIKQRITGLCIKGVAQVTTVVDVVIIRVAETCGGPWIGIVVGIVVVRVYPSIIIIGIIRIPTIAVIGIPGYTDCCQWRLWSIVTCAFHSTSLSGKFWRSLVVILTTTTTTGSIIIPTSIISQRRLDTFCNRAIILADVWVIGTATICFAIVVVETTFVFVGRAKQGRSLLVVKGVFCIVAGYQVIWVVVRMVPVVVFVVIAVISCGGGVVVGPIASVITSCSPHDG